MKIAFSINDNVMEKPIIQMLSKSKMFYHLPLNEISKSTDKKIIILKTDTSEEDFYETVEMFTKDELNNIFFLIHSKLNTLLISKNFKKIVYPIYLKDLLKKIENQGNNKYYFSDLLLGTGNKLQNTKSKKSVHMTETESEIIRCLFLNKEIEKEAIRQKILNLNKEVETKSLDSHLSRIRKKIKEVGSDVDISTLNSKILISSLVG